MLITVNLSKHTSKTKSDILISTNSSFTWLRWRSLQGNSGCHGSEKHPPLGILGSPQPSHDWRSLWTSWRGNPNTRVLIQVSLLITTCSQVICMWLQRSISHELTLAFAFQHSFLVRSPRDHVSLPWTSRLEILGSV